MAGEEDVPPWVTFILGQVQQQFEGMNRRLDSLVTRDAFGQEQARVNERFSAMGREISDLKTAVESLKASLQAEATSRVTAETALAKERAKEQQDKEKDQATRRWQIFALIASPFVAALIVWILSGGLAAPGAGS